MRIAISTYSLAKWRRREDKTLDDALQWLSQHGPNCVEFTNQGDFDVDQPVALAESLAQRCRELGLTPVSYCTGAELLKSPSEQESEIEKQKQNIDVAAALGVPSMRHDITRGPADGDERTFQDVLDIVCPAIRQIADFAQARGVKTSLENHGFYMQASRRVAQLIDSVDHPNFGLTLDLGNFLCVNEDPVQAVARLAGYAQMVHAKDFHIVDKQRQPLHGWITTPDDIAIRGAILGHGCVDLRAQFRLLREAGYDGVVSIEFEGLEDPPTALTYAQEELARILADAGVEIDNPAAA